jgi:hypothetical protein
MSGCMYQVTCEECGQVDFHPSRTAAEMKAERHLDNADHTVFIETMNSV